MKNIDATNARKDSDLLTAFHGLETVYDPQQRKDIRLAVMETAGGDTKLVSNTALMEIQMNFSMVSKANAGSAQRYELLEKEELVAMQGMHALEQATAAALAGQKNTYASPTFSTGSMQQVAALLAKHMKPQAGG